MGAGVVSGAGGKAGVWVRFSVDFSGPEFFPKAGPGVTSNSTLTMRFLKGIGVSTRYLFLCRFKPYHVGEPS